jgi:hypothetical protein
LEHLKEEIRSIASGNREEKILHVKKEFWIGYTLGNRIIAQLEDLLDHPVTARMPNMLVVGETNNGKTAIAMRFAKQHQPFTVPGDNRIIVPVVMVQAPPVPDEKRFYNGILEKVFAPFRSNDRADKKQMQVIHILKNLQTKMLVIDEIQHVLAGNTSKQRGFLNVIKFLGNELQIPIVCLGTQEAFNAIHSDPQLANRFHPAVLPRWQFDEDYLRLLASFERVLPLTKPSALVETKVAQKILAMSEGTIGEIHAVLRKGAIAAINSGEERISLKTLEKIDWISPSNRKRQMDRLG